MQNTIKSYLEALSVHDCQTFLNLQCFPITSDSESAVDYLTLDEAMQQYAIAISEVDVSGTVPELKVTNKSGRKVIILDGEELVGAKQNRIVNTTILIAENSTCIIPVSCVEQGRWSYYESREFSSKSRTMPSYMRAKKAQQVHRALRREGKHTSDQREIWDDIHAFSSRMQAYSSSGEMGAIFEKKKAEIKQYADNFSILPNQVGALFAINGKIAGLDCFGKRNTLQKVFQKLVESYALDAIDQYQPGTPLNVSQANDVELFIDSLKNGNLEFHDAVSLGTDTRITAEGTNGFALVFENSVLHLAAFSEERADINNYGRMSRFSSRRRNRGF